MVKILYLVTGFLFLLSRLQAQDLKDSTYYSKIAAPDTKMISVYNGKYKVFTQKIGNGKVNLLLLHGGPENTHEYFENFPEQLKQAGVTVYFYDQLGSYFSDTPDDSTIWNVARFVEEVEEVRRALKIDRFYLLGHSWGGMLAELYAARYGQHLKGLILSNVPGFFANDTKYLSSVIDSMENVVRRQATLLPQFKNNKAQVDSISKRLKLADTTTHKALTRQFNKAADSLFVRTMYYHKEGKMPEPLIRNFRHLRFESLEKYNFNPFGADYKEALQQIKTPTLLIGGKNDFLHPEAYHDIKRIMTKAKVRVYISPTGAHFTMWDDSEYYFKELSRFIYEVEGGIFDPSKSP
jgi:proline iminopeptidase